MIIDISQLCLMAVCDLCKAKSVKIKLQITSLFDFKTLQSGCRFKILLQISAGGTFYFVFLSLINYVSVLTDSQQVCQIKSS